jgi:PAS domain S-box-containing protein
LGRDRSGIIIRDITARKVAEDALRLHSAALNSAVNAIVITDAKGIVQWANPSFSILSGYSIEEVLGNNLGKLVTSGKQDPAYYANMWTTISSGNIWRGEIINRRKDGSLYYEEEAITPVCDRNNIITHFVAIKQDITDRKNSERLLFESEERLQLALRAANQGLYDLNFLTGEIMVNDTYFRMLGYDPLSSKESVESWLGRLHPDDRAAIDSNFQSILKGESNELREEYRERSQNGEWRWINSVGKTVQRDGEGKPLRMVGTRTDITETKNNSLKMSRLLEESNLRLRRLAALREIDQAISSNFFLNSTLSVLVEQVKNQLHVDGVSVLLFDDIKQSFFLAASEGIHRQPGGVTPITVEDSLAGKVAFEGKVIQIEDIKDPSIDERLKSFLVDEGFVDYFGSPINAKGKLKGVLEVFHRTPTEVDAEWMSFLATLSGQAAVAIENAQLFESLQNVSQNLLQAYDATIKGWSMAMDLRDHETEGHTERVTEMTIAIARRMDFTEEELVHIRRGTLLHDIGKMGVPDSILLKPEPLTPEERKTIEQHPRYAYEMLKSIDYLHPALTIPHLHHEKWDGTGYPNGLKGEEIPLEARLFAVVDVFDALTSDRPYRSCWSQEAALKHIQDEAGHHFDPDIVKIFTEYLASGVKFGC